MFKYDDGMTRLCFFCINIMYHPGSSDRCAKENKLFLLLVSNSKKFTCFKAKRQEVVIRLKLGHLMEHDQIMINFSENLLRYSLPPFLGHQSSIKVPFTTLIDPS